MESTAEESITPSARARLVVAVVLATMAGMSAGLAAASTAASGVPGDFEFWWRGTQLWVSGGNPYSGIPHSSGWPLPDPLFYPLPALILTWPLHALNLPVAAGMFMGASTGLLAWALTARGWWRLWLLAGAPFVMAVKLGQWSPLLVAGALLPWAALALAAKPTLGLALAMYRFDRRAILWYHNSCSSPINWRLASWRARVANLRRSSRCSSRHGARGSHS